MNNREVHISFLRHRHGLYLKLAVLLSVICIAWYLLDQPLEGAAGSSLLGYGLGSFGGLLILWLCWLGVRKRQYRASGNLRGWVSAHVYLGTALLVIGTLHTGFQLGFNIHTLNWLLMVLVILSGMIGVACYVGYPARLGRGIENRTKEQVLAEIMDLNERAIALADPLGPDVHRTVVRSASRIQIGGSFWRQLLGAGGQKSSADRLEKFIQLEQRSSEQADPAMSQTTRFMASQILHQPDVNRGEQLRRLLDVLARRDELVTLLNRSITTMARMRAWLYLHVPLSIGLLAALLAHVIVVFLYW